ncbi:MAG: adenylate kinase [Planctomycetota bacterium]
MRIVLLGAPGAGKGTQCKRIADRCGSRHLSSGDILRRHRTAGTELGQKAQSYMDSGGLVPDEIIVEMMAEAIKQSPGSGFVLDGFPRTVNQAAELDKSLSANSERIDLVLNLRIDDQVVLDRISGRRSCPECGAVYHIEKLKPKVEGKCDKDGAELIQRPDDTAEVVANRLRTYHQQTEPVVNYYRQNNSVCEIDASKTVDEISVVISEKLEALAKA